MRVFRSWSAGSVLFVAATAAPCLAQSGLPRLLVPERLLPSAGAAPLSWRLDALPSAPFAIFVDVSGGPVVALGVRYQLGLTPALTLLDAGVVPAFGQRNGSVAVPIVAGIVDQPFHLQAVVVNAAAPNGAFEVSNGESTVIASVVGAHSERFDDAAMAGFTGTFDGAIRDRIQGAPIRRRTVSTVGEPNAVVFGQPLATPLNHFGARAQMCFRTRDLGSTGEPELVTALRWRAFGGRVAADSFDRLDIRMSHTLVVPDFTIDPWSALPMFPNSGLDPVFANNVKPGETPLLVASGRYVITSTALRADGYVDYPLQQPFAWNGVESLLLDLRMSPSANPGSGANGTIVRLNVQSSAQPNARVVVQGTAAAPIDPNVPVQGTGDNVMHDYQFELTRVRSVAQSPWRDSRTAVDYQAPIVARVQPAGTAVEIEFRGADDAQGTRATAWSTNVDVADGRRFLQYRLTFVADAATGAVPAIDTLIVPYR